MKRSKPDNSHLIQAWIRLEEALQETNDFQNEKSNPEFKSLLYSTAHRSNNNYMQQSTQNQKQDVRPFTATTEGGFNKQKHTESQQNIGNQIYPISKVSSLKSLMNLRANARPHTRPSTANIHAQKTDLKILSGLPSKDMEELIEKSEVINSLNVDQILDLFTAKCIDSKVDYKPEQAVVFVDKMKKNCINGVLFLKECGLGLESANVLAHILQDNQYFSRLVLEKNLLGNSGAALIGEALKYNEQIIFLNLISNDITQDGFSALFEALLENQTIISVDISSKEGLYRNKLGLKGSQYLNNYLRYTSVIMFLSLSNMSINLEALGYVLQGVQNCPSLVFLDLSHNDLGAESVQLLIESLQDLNLEELNLASNKLGDHGIQQFTNCFSAMQKHYRCEKYNFSDNLLTAIGISRIFENLHKNANITELILDNNKFYGRSFESIITMLWENLTLQVLSLNNCQIEQDGADWIGVGLSKNRTLKQLHLNNNKAKNYGAKGIAEGIKDHPNIKILELERNSIDDEGGIIIAEVLKRNESLEYINLKENNLKDYTGAQLTESCRENKKIIKINLERNAISYKFTEEIQKYLNQNLYRKKKNQIPEYVIKMEELKVFESQQFDVKEQQNILKDRAMQAQKDLLAQQDRNKKQEEKEKELTLQQEYEYHQLKDDYKNFEHDIEGQIKQFEKLISENNSAINHCSKQIGGANYEITSQKAEITKNKQIIYTNQVRYAEGILSKDKLVKEWMNKAHTSATGYESFIRQIETLRHKIEQGSDSEDEDEKNKKQLEQEQKLKAQQEAEKALQQQKNKKKNTKKPGKKPTNNK